VVVDVRTEDLTAENAESAEKEGREKRQAGSAPSASPLGERGERKILLPRRKCQIVPDRALSPSANGVYR
jgi:hypothetical protein